MNMMAAYYIDTMAKEHWQEMRSDQRTNEAVRSSGGVNVAERLKGVIAALTAILRWNRLPLGH
jgi:hypothetical protein